MSELTYEKLQQYHSKEVSCVICGFMINKEIHPHTLERDGNGDWVKMWVCPFCRFGCYTENISKLRELGLE